MINFRYLTVEIFHEGNSEIPLPPSNLLTLNSSVILPPREVLVHEICTRDNYGGIYSIYQESFTYLEENNCFRSCKLGKNGTQKD